ncbi:MAG: hypothetical protein WA125_16740 [Desulfosporosinus sp.]
MTRDEIIAMVPGRELDEAIGKVIDATPKIMWYAMNKEEAAYFMDFERENAANNWHGDMMTNHSNSRYVANGGHIVRKEIYRRYSEDISAALEVAEKFDFYCVDKGGDYGNSQYGATVEICLVDGTYSPFTVRATTIPEAICKAALLAMEE